MKKPNSYDKKVVEIYTKGEESYKDLLERMKKETEKFECIERTEQGWPKVVRRPSDGLTFSIGDHVMHKDSKPGEYEFTITYFWEHPRFFCGFGAGQDDENKQCGNESLTMLIHKKD